jgi:hypothetical protein
MLGAAAVNADVPNDEAPDDALIATSAAIGAPAGKIMCRGQAPYRGPAGAILHRLALGLRAAMDYVGAATISDCRKTRSSCE